MDYNTIFSMANIQDVRGSISPLFHERDSKLSEPMSSVPLPCRLLKYPDMDTHLKTPCVNEFSRGNGTGVAEALGNWGFSNDRVASGGQELRRLKCLFAKMDGLRTSKPSVCVRYDCRNDPEAWHVRPSPHECKPVWTFPSKRPFITYSSTADVLVVSDLLRPMADLAFPIPGRGYYVQKSTSKWYKRGPDCCPQPSCLAPQCPGRSCGS